LALRPHPSRHGYEGVDSDPANSNLPQRRSERRSVRRPMRRPFRTRVCFYGYFPQGLHPGLVCDAPLGHGIGNTVGARHRKRGRPTESET
jgi:hypothetical protein